jgi:hypothetical protein
MGEWSYNSSILDLGPKLWWVVSFTSRPLYPGERTLSTHWIGGRVGSRVCLDAVLLLPGNEPWLSSPQLVTIPTELPRLPQRSMRDAKIPNTALDYSKLQFTCLHFLPFSFHITGARRNQRFADTASSNWTLLLGSFWAVQVQEV